MELVIFLKHLFRNFVGKTKVTVITNNNLDIIITITFMTKSFYQKVIFVFRKIFYGKN